MKYHGKTKKNFLRQLCIAITIVILGFILWGVKNYFFFQPNSDAIILGKFSRYKKDQIIHKKKERLFIIRDSLGLYAVSDICTHRGCMLLIKDKKIVCPCHGANFTLNGQPVSGPANKPLDNYYIYKNKQKILIVDVTHTINKDFHYSE